MWGGKRMDWKAAKWLLAVFDEVLETDDAELVELFLEKNPQVISLLEKRAEENGIEDKDILAVMKDYVAS